MRPRQIADVVRLQRAQRLSPEKLRAVRNVKLRALIRHAYGHVPFYRNLMDGLKLKPDDIRTVEDLPRLPLLSRTILQGASRSDVVADNIPPGDCISATTSGTTAEPLKVLYRREDWTLMNLTWVRAFLAAGLSPWEKRAAFVGRREPAEGKQWYERLGLWRRLDVSTWLDRSSWIEAVRSWKPAALVGYVMTLRVFAESVREAGVTDIRPRLVFATGGMLDDETRRILRDVLGAEVVDVFASVEGGCLAWECRACGGYHLSEDTVIVEVLKDGRPARPGESGEAVITNLHSWAMPLIRFQSGDDVALAEAAPSCGLRLPLLSGVQGRVNDCIVFKTGERISSQPFYFAVQDVPGVKRWRITQESIDRLLVEIEPGAGFDEAAERAIVGSLEQLVRGTMAVTLSRVASFPFNPDRKFRQIRSKVAGRA